MLLSRIVLRKLFAKTGKVRRIQKKLGMLEKHMGRMLDDVYQERVNGLLDKLFTEKSTTMEIL